MSQSPASGRRAGSRRAAAPPPDPRAGRRLALLGAVVALTVAVVVVAGLLPTPAADPAPGVTSGESDRDLVCPAAPRLPAGTLALGGTAEGRVDLDDEAQDLAAGGVARARVGDDPVVVRASGAVATDLAGVVAGRGLAAACTDPRATWWFSGAGAAPGRESALVLTNPRSGVATVDVAVYGPRGPVEAPDLRGVSVPPGETVSYPLAEVAPAAGDVTLAVTSARGLVSAAVLDRVSPTSRVAEWIPAQQTPSRSLVVPGVPRGLGTAALLLTNPGELAAVAEVRLSAETGSFAPDDLPATSVPPGATVRVELPRSAVREQTSVRVAADAPLVAGVTASAGADIAHAGAVRPWTGEAVAAPPGRRRTLVVAAEGEAVTVSVTLRTARGRALPERRLEVAAEGTATLTLPPRAASLVLSSARPVAAAVVLRDGGQSVVPVLPGAARSGAPEVRPAG